MRGIGSGGDGVRTQTERMLEGGIKERQLELSDSRGSECTGFTWH